MNEPRDIAIRGQGDRIHRDRSSGLARQIGVNTLYITAPSQRHWYARRPDDEIHALVDVLGRPLTPGNTSDIKGADLLIATAGMKRVITDRGYHANHLRAALRDHGTIPVIPAGATANAYPV